MKLVIGWMANYWCICPYLWKIEGLKYKYMFPIISCKKYRCCYGYSLYILSFLISNYYSVTSIQIFLTLFFTIYRSACIIWSVFYLEPSSPIGPHSQKLICRPWTWESRKETTVLTFQDTAHDRTFERRPNNVILTPCDGMGFNF